MIELDTSLYLSSGGQRDVYIHPLYRDRCIKIGKTDLNTNDIESKFFIKYKNCPALPQYFGIVETNLGHGLVVELIHDFTGEVSKSLEYYLSNKVLSIREALFLIDRLESTLKPYNVLIHDINLQNILLRKNEDLTLHPIMIDGFGPRKLCKKSMIKMIFPILVKRKSKKVFKRMADRLIETYSKN